MRSSKKLAISILLGALLVGVGPARAGEPAPAPKAAAPAAGEVTLKGLLGCGKCSFHEAKACENVLKVKHADASGHARGEVEDTYLLADNDVSRANHERVCGPPAPATVTGTVTEEKTASKGRPRKAARKVLTATAITFD